VIYLLFVINSMLSEPVKFLEVAKKNWKSSIFCMAMLFLVDEMALMGEDVVMLPEKARSLFE